MKTILITGFEPFGGEKTNPSYEAVKLLPDEINGAKIIKAELPVSFENSIVVLDKYLSAELSAVICVGQAGGRGAVTPERIAVNVQSAASPDNDGVIKTEEIIHQNGADGYFSTLDINKIVKTLNCAGIPSQISNSAGTYVCNSVMYHLLYRINSDLKDTIGGFVHVPYSCEQAAAKSGCSPSLPLEMISKALYEIINCCI